MSGGVESDHSAVRLDLMMTLLKHRASAALTRGTTDWQKIATHNPTRTQYNNILLAATNSIAMSYKDFNNAIITTGANTALIVQSTHDDWFQYLLDNLAPIIAIQNEVLDALCSAKTLPPSIVKTMRDSL
jgi:hypothetical protein